MTPRFLQAIPYVLQHEGGLNNEKNDSGQITNMGISLSFIQSIHDDVNHDGKVDSNDIITLTLQEAEDIYFNNFWRPAYDVLPARVAIKVFDVAVNTGVGRANMFLQKSLNALGSNIGVDGLLGQQTINECNKYTDVQILTEYCSIQKAYYEAIVANNPSQSIFLNGWISRSEFVPPITA
jgi:lysozyme family protein